MNQISKVCVIGAGVMGRQIALNAAVSGFSVILADEFSQVLEDAEAWTNEYLNKGLAKGKYTAECVAETRRRLCYILDVPAAVKYADLVIEAIVEREDIKRQLFGTISKFAPKNALIVSNSSYILSSAFADVVENPTRLANLHYFNPAMHMQLVEIVKGPHTGDETVEALQSFVVQTGKTSILVKKEIEGFVVNRLLRAIQNEAFYLYENGIATFEDIDFGAEKGLNYPMGPFRLLDLTGIDICYYNRQKKFEQTGDPKDAPPAFIEEKFKNREFGKKTGKGWYTYNK